MSDIQTLLGDEADDVVRPRLVRGDEGVPQIWQNTLLQVVARLVRQQPAVRGRHPARGPKAQEVS